MSSNSTYSTVHSSLSLAFNTTGTTHISNSHLTASQLSNMSATNGLQVQYCNHLLNIFVRNHSYTPHCHFISYMSYLPPDVLATNCNMTVITVVTSVLICYPSLVFFVLTSSSLSVLTACSC